MDELMHGRLSKIGLIISNELEGSMKEVETQLGREIMLNEIVPICDAFRNAVDRTERKLFDAFKAAYFKEPHKMLTEEEVKCIEETKGCEIDKVFLALKEITHDKRVNRVCDVLLGKGEKLNPEVDDDFGTFRQCFFEIIVFIKLYNHNRVDKIIEHISMIDNIYHIYNQGGNKNEEI